MENIEYLHQKLLRIEAEIKNLEEINNENNMKIQILKDEHKHINSELSYKLDELSSATLTTATSSSSFATAASISRDYMAKRVVDEPLVASRILAVDDNGESEEIKTKGSKWNR
jgi:hypothetical protein